MDHLIYNKDAVKEFFEYLVKSYQKSIKKGEAKEKLGEHIEKVKELSTSKKSSKKKIEQEFKKLEKHLADVIALEKGMLGKKEDPKIAEELKERINKLEQKLKEHNSMKKERQKKIKKLEQRIKSKAEGKTGIITEKAANIETIALRDRLYDLEEKYHDLKEKGIPESKLKLIKIKIEKLKQKL